MKLHLLENRSGSGYTTFGSAWEKGKIREHSFTLKNSGGKTIPVQSRVTAFWPDGSVRWAAHTARAEEMGPEADIFPGENPVSPETQVRIVHGPDGYQADTGCFRLLIPDAGAAGGAVAENLERNGRIAVRKITPVLLLASRQDGKSRYEGTETVKVWEPAVKEVSLEESGPLESVFRFAGTFADPADRERHKMRFILRMYLYADRPEIRFVHTFLFEGNENEDFLKGMGIRFETALSGEKYERHIQFATEADEFHEAGVLLNSRNPRLPVSVLKRQLEGDTADFHGNPDIRGAAENLPVWDRYFLWQGDADHWEIRKQTHRDCCEITCRQGRRAPGAMAVSGAGGGIALGIRDFWQKNPSCLEADGLSAGQTACTAWFYAPQSQSCDFRHYDRRAYAETSYEGFEDIGADPNGIAVTGECRLELTDRMIAEKELRAFAKRLQKPPVYCGDPAWYHSVRAFGYWSLPSEETETERWIERQLSQAFDFYRKEVEARHWYGLFDYGDVMHTYDPVRHCWRYDMGGFAWQNTELVPTFWLWLYFLRTGREDVFTMAEAMTRHTSEVDFYHFGDKKGIGSRHNVRHWGCSCKEPRVAMAGHHRFYYYLTGDLRTGEAMDDARDADESMMNLIHYPKTENEGRKEVIIRSGPDWVSLLSDWMAAAERTMSPRYIEKIQKGLEALENAPFGMASGPEFAYCPEDGSLRYLGEEENAGMHLQICMGGIETLTELACAAGSSRLEEMLAAYGRFYLLTPEQKSEETGGAIFRRDFSFPYFASALAAYSAAVRGDRQLARAALKVLLRAIASEDNTDGFLPVTYASGNDGESLTEIPWIKTNFASQWCLNMIVSLDFIRGSLPRTMEELREFVKDVPGDNFHIA